MSWNPDQYLKFAEPRMRPALDLLARITIDTPEEVCDLGCGTGSLTRLLAERWPQARVTGVDSSAAMLAKAREPSGTIDWVHADLDQWQADRAPHLVYSNAALHWLGNHRALFPRLMASLAPGGVLAVQMPRNFNAPSHTLIAETVMNGPWRQQLQAMLQPSPVAEPAAYFDMLAAHAQSIDIWETEYLQVLTGTDPVKEWTKGTWLAPFLAALAPPEREAFERDYATRVRAAYPPREDGRTLFPFKRLFIIARRATRS